MYNTANNNHSEYNEEHICEIVACSNDFINEVVEQYKNKSKTKLYADGKLIGVLTDKD